MEIAFVAVVWLAALLIVLRGYSKLSEEEKVEVKKKIKRSDIMLTQGFRTIGLLFMVTGLYYPIFLGIGIVMVSISLFATGYFIYDSNRKGSILAIIASIAVMFIYFVRCLWDIMV